MFKKINKVPAGMFLIPLVVSLVLVSIFLICMMQSVVQHNKRFKWGPTLLLDYWYFQLGQV